MREAKPTSSSPAPDSATPAQPANISPGMATLLRRNQPASNAENKDDTTPASQKSAPRNEKLPLLKISLLVADLLLMGLAACLAWRKGSFGLIEAGLCVLAVGLGAWLACLALWFGGDDAPKE